MKKWISTLRRFFAPRPVNAENSAQRVLESILPVASLYGVDVANIDPEWFHDKTLNCAGRAKCTGMSCAWCL